jgi:hypothetical protein
MKGAEPLLNTMFAGGVLSEVKTVQTLSRLNHTPAEERRGDAPLIYGAPRPASTCA